MNIPSKVKKKEETSRRAQIQMSCNKKHMLSFSFAFNRLCTSIYSCHFCSMLRQFVFWFNFNYSRGILFYCKSSMYITQKTLRTDKLAKTLVACKSIYCRFAYFQNSNQELFCISNIDAKLFSNDLRQQVGYLSQTLTKIKFKLYLTGQHSLGRICNVYKDLNITGMQIIK